MEWLPDTACTETLEPRRQELREAAEQNSPEEPSLHGEGATDSRDEFGAEKATQRSIGSNWGRKSQAVLAPLRRYHTLKSSVHFLDDVRDF